MQNTEYADFNWEKRTLHVQRKPWRHFRVKGKKKNKSAKDSFISIPAPGWLCRNLEKIRDGRDVRILRRRQSPPFWPAPIAGWDRDVASTWDLLPRRPR